MTGHFYMSKGPAVNYSHLGWLWVVCKFGGWKAEYKGFSKEVKNQTDEGLLCNSLDFFCV